MSMSADSDKRKLKILFVLRSTGEWGVFRSVISALTQRGHFLTVLFDKSLSKKYPLEHIKAQGRDMTPSVVYDWTRPFSRRGTLIFHSRELLSYRRYLLVTQAWFYGERWRKYLHLVLQRLTEWKLFRYFLRFPFVGFFLHLIETFTPPIPDIVTHLQELNPDVVLASPVNMRFSSADLEYLKAAKTMNIQTVLPVLSWDSLTNKGLLHIVPDLLLVWNETQKREAVSQHQIPAARVRITGAPYFDSWFDSFHCSTTREEFCAHYALRPEDFIILYFGSSIVGTDDESLMVREIRRVLDGLDNEKLQSAQIIVRPHPTHYKIYENIENEKGIWIIPKIGEMPDSPQQLQLFYDTLYHSAAVLEGANTSAIIEVMILGRPVIAIWNNQRSQTDVQHFTQLIDEKVLEFVRTPKELLSVLQKAVNGIDEHKDARMRYIVNYLRPRGLRRPAGEVVAEEIEKFMEIKL